MNDSKTPPPPQSQLQAQQLTRIAEFRDRAAFAEIYGYFGPRLKSYLLGLKLESPQADDLVQEIMILVWRKAHLYDPAKAQVSTWIFRIARNKFIDKTRQQKIVEVDADDQMLHLPAEDQTDRRAIVNQTSVHIHRALAVLKPELREVLEKSFLEEMSHSEIAEALDLPLGTVKSRIRLAFKTMRGLLGDGQ